MKARDRSLLWLQYSLGQAAALILAPFYFLAIRFLGYRVRDLRALRAAWARHLEDHEGPWILCANHLTMVDSLLLSYALFSWSGDVRRFRQVPWNLPEKANFQRSALVAVLCYLSKCLPLSRGGDRDAMRQALDKCLYLLDRGQNILVFPEGGRSRTGRVDREGFSYGVGRFVQACGPLRIMCLYLRGDGQDAYSTMPARGERFTLTMERLELEKGELQGLRLQRHYADQIVRRLAEMEEAYFALRGQRCGGPERPLELRKKRGQALSQPRLHAE